MKKMLVLLMVLGMASLANAGVYLTINGAPADPEITLEPSDWIEIDTEADPGFIGGDFVIELSNNQAHFDATGMVLTQEWAFYLDPLLTKPWTLNWVPVTGEATGPQRVTFGGGNTSAADATLRTEILMQGLMLHCDEPTDVTLTLYEIRWEGTEKFYDEIDFVLIHQIPEPMTMALLGLGGLFLRRRR